MEHHDSTNEEAKNLKLLEGDSAAADDNIPEYLKTDSKELVQKFIIRHPAVQLGSCRTRTQLGEREERMKRRDDAIHG